MEGHIRTNKKFHPTPVSHTGKIGLKRKVHLRKTMSWTAWTDKSTAIPFKSSRTGTGDGEDKVAAEMGTCALGQNSPHDMEFLYNEKHTKFDVKKLDKQNDFNTGKEGRDALRPLKHNLATLLMSIAALSENSFFTHDEQELLGELRSVSPDEIASGTLQKLSAICEMLHPKEKALRATLPTVSFTVLSSTNEMPLDLYYYTCQKLAIPFPEEYRSFEDTILILQHMDHKYIHQPNTMMEELNGLAQQLFTEVKLIVVDSEKGYRIVTDTNQIKFYRITRGHPRFKIVL